MHCAPGILCGVKRGRTTLQCTHVAQYCQHTSIQSPQRQNAGCLALVLAKTDLLDAPDVNTPLW
jgi:hypothetical protein